jgi:hypothetical protein
MKNKFKHFWNITIILVIGLFFTTCDDGNTENYDNSNDPTIPSVPSGPNITFSGTPKIGEELTAISNDGEFFGDFSWSFAENSNATTTYGMNNVLPYGDNKSKITIPDTLLQGSNSFSSLGKYIYVYRRYGMSGYSAIGVIGPITN